jgi:tetratricopeptide (TPR) repeat protein
MSGMRLSLLMSIVFVTAVSYAQSPCGIINDYTEAVYNKDTAKSIQLLNKFQQLYPTNPLIEDVHAALLSAYLGSGKLEQAKQIGLSILNLQPTNLYGYLPGDYNKCPFYNDSTKHHSALVTFQYLNELQYRACVDLYQLYSTQKKFDSALYCLQFVDSSKLNSFLNPYRNLLRGYDIDDFKMKYSEVYENLKDYNKAIGVLTYYLYLNAGHGGTSRFIYLLNKYKHIDSVALKKMLYQSLDSLTIEYGATDFEGSKKEVKDEFDSSGELVRTTSTIEYGRTVLWHFWGTEFFGAVNNDYISYKTKNKITDKELLLKAKENVQKYVIFQAIMDPEKFNAPYQRRVGDSIN